MWLYLDLLLEMKTNSIKVVRFIYSFYITVVNGVKWLASKAVNIQQPNSFLLLKSKFDKHMRAQCK